MGPLVVLTAAAVLALDKPPATPHLGAVRTTQPPVIDGRLDDAAWRAAPGTEAFTQQYPFDGAQPSERTHLSVLYDDDAVYVGFDCEQIHTPIVELLTRRDRDSESEWVWVLVDSRNDGKSAFVFAVNIAGVLADGLIIDQTNYSWEWDENWEAKTARTERGWSAEIRIPLRILRFDSRLPVQSWGFQATRFIAQRQESDLWAYFPRDVATPVAFLGRLDDLRDLKTGGTLELRPFVLGEVARSGAGPDMLGSGWAPAGSAGLDLRWHLAQDLTLDAAFNPDFAQVEADQVILNLTNFETQLPEKRPFFLEGMDAFSFPLQVFYSRRIGAAPPAPTAPTNAMGTPTELAAESPSPATIFGAGKMVGRLGPSWTVGALSALTGQNSLVYVDATGVRASRLAAPTTAFNVLRVKRELGGAGHVGLIATAANAFQGDASYPLDPLAPGDELCPSGASTPVGDRCFHNAYVGGVDGRWRSASAEYLATGAFLQSYIQGGPTQPVPELDGTVIGPGSTGSGGWLRIAKEGGRHLLWSAEYAGSARKLQYNDVGYMARQNLQHGKVSLGWRTLDAGAYTLETTSAFEVSDNRNLAGLDLGMLYELNTRVRLLNFSTVVLAADFGPSRYDDREVGDGTALEFARNVGGRLELYADPRGRFTGSLTNQTQIMGAGAYATATQASLLCHALHRLDLELIPLVKWTAGEYRYIHQVTSATDYYFGKLATKNVSATLRATYTFTPQLTLQAYAQAFLASGTFSDARAIARPTAPSAAVGSTVTLARLAAAPAAVFAPTDNPDFEDAALNLNVVFRWEYRLGATLYFVYTHSQVPTVPLTEFMAPATLSPGAFGHGQTSDVVLLKLSYWWAS